MATLMQAKKRRRVVKARAARLHAHGAPVRVEDVDLTDAGHGDVRVDLAFAGVNPVDTYMAEGRVAPDGPLPRVLGGEASGFLDGRPVLVAGAGLGASRDGLWASAAIVPEHAVIPLPEGVGIAEAAAVGVAGLTAWDTVQLGDVRSGERVLVLGASGGVGLAIVSLAGATGASVWGQTSSERKAQAVRGQGAEVVVVADADGLAEALGAWRPTVVIDALGGAFTSAAVELLAPGGRIVLFGASAGAVATLNLQTVYRKSLWILGYGGLTLSQDERRERLGQALSAVADGRLRIPIDRVLPLDHIEDAFELLAERAVTGKVLLDLRRCGSG
jgi:NADPH:quinone reductase